MTDTISGPVKMLPRVTDVKVCDDYRLLLRFTNGEKRIFDASYLLDYPAFKRLADVFPCAKVEYGTVVWPGDIDNSPDTLYLRSTPLSDNV